MRAHNDYGRHKMPKDMPTGPESGYTPTNTIFHKFLVKFTNIFNLIFNRDNLPPSNIDMIHPMSVQIKFIDYLTVIL